MPLQKAFLVLAATLASATAVDAAVAATAATNGEVTTQYVIGISPFLHNSVKDEVYRGLVRLLVEDLPLNSTLAVYDAFNLKSVSQVTLPGSRVFNSPKTRANQFAAAIRQFKLFLAEEHAKPVNAHLNFEAALRVPQFCEFLAQNLPATNAALSLMLIGSPLHQDAKEPAFSMVDGFFPSDGHLRASRDSSVYGFSSEAGAIRPIVVHWIYFGDPWVSDLHKEKVFRFWTLYFEARSGRLDTFCGDFPTVLRAFRQEPAAIAAAPKRWALDPQETKIEMLRVTRNVEITDWITRDTLPETAPQAPAIMVGPMRIGIRWKQSIDLDLYAAPRRGAETLFFQHPRSSDGYYYKDHRLSPGREFEFIEFETPVDAREVEAFVNFYKGACSQGPRGEVRIEFDGRIYRAQFSIPASEGNRGRSGHDQREFWTRIPVQEILKISAASDRAG